MLTQKSPENKRLEINKMNFSNEKTRIASPSEVLPRNPPNLQFCKPSSPPHVPISPKKKENFSTCSIEEETSQSKLIFPKFFRKIQTIRNMPSLPNLPTGGFKRVNTFNDFGWGGQQFFSPGMRKRSEHGTNDFVKPAARRLLEFNKSQVSNFSFTNCFFESNLNRVNINACSLVKPIVRNNSFSQIPKLGAVGLNRNTMQVGVCKQGSFVDNSNVFVRNLDSQKSPVQSKVEYIQEESFSIKDNFSFTKSRIAPFLEKPKILKNLGSNKIQIKKQGVSKTKKIQKMKKFKSDEIYQIIKQVVREVKMKRVLKKLKIKNQTSAFCTPSFYYHHFVNIEKPCENKFLISKGILEVSDNGFYPIKDRIF